jgi:hypothetical protein
MSQDKLVVRSLIEISPRDISPIERLLRLPNAYRKRNSISSSCSKSDYSSEDDYKKVKQKSDYIPKSSSSVSSKSSSSSTHSKNKESCHLKKKRLKRSLGNRNV